MDAKLAHPWNKSLREISDVEDLQSIVGVHDLPFQAKIGSVTILETSDGQVVLGVRGKTMIAGNNPPELRKKVHFVAEGMIPEDRDETGNLNPIETSKRGLEEELMVGTTSQSIGHLVELKSTGFFFDQLRFQPCFTYLAKTEVSFDDLKTGASAAKDAWENESLVSMPLSIDAIEMRQLMLGRHPDFELASNHAAAGLWFALIFKHGFVYVKDSLSRNPAA